MRYSEQTCQVPQVESDGGVIQHGGKVLGTEVNPQGGHHHLTELLLGQLVDQRGFTNTSVTNNYYLAVGQTFLSTTISTTHLQSVGDTPDFLLCLPGIR